MVRRLKKKPTRGPLIAAVHLAEQLPMRRRPVVAFVGRSNVGKSSLLNRLLGTKAARVSKTPGRTRGIDFYETAGEEDFVDLPGTGFARVSREERAGWGELADRFFRSGRVALAVHTIDALVRDAPGDLVMRDYLSGLEVARLPVATKWDRLSTRERSLARRRLEEIHGNVIPVSAKTGEGIETLRGEIRRRLTERGTSQSSKPANWRGTLRSPKPPRRGGERSHG